MPDTISGFSDLGGANMAHAMGRFLKNADAENTTARYATVFELPQHMGDTLKLRRYFELDIADTPLSEFHNPTPIIPTYEDVDIVVREYGATAIITKKVVNMHQDPIGQILSDASITQFARTSQRVDFNALKAGSNVYYAGGVTSRGSVTTALAKADIQRVVRQFNKDGATPIKKRIKAGLGFNTEPVEQAYVAFCHTDLRQDIEALEGFVPVHEYADAGTADPLELGKCAGVRFILHREAPIWAASGASSASFLVNGEPVTAAASCDVYPIMVISLNSWTRVPLAGQHTVKPILLNPKESHSDPTGRTGYIVWTAHLAAGITNDDWVARIEVPCSDLG